MAEKDAARRVTLIAEVGSTHDGSIGNALRAVEVFGPTADFVKFQDHRWQRVAPGPHPSPRVHEDRGRYYRRTAFDRHEWDSVAERCRDMCSKFMVSCFSVEAVADQATRADALKVASGEVTNLPLLQAMRDTGLPVFLSTGMSTIAEVSAAKLMIDESLACVMQCTSEYPCPPDRVGLDSIGKWFDPGWGWGRAVGLSDHTMGLAASLGAIALGATVIERHVTLSRELYGSDAAHSLEPDEWHQFVREVRDLEVMLASDVDKDKLAATPEMQQMRKTFMQGVSK